MPTTGIRIDGRIEGKLLQNPKTRPKVLDKDPFGRGQKAGLYTQILHQVFTDDWKPGIRLLTPDEQDIFFGSLHKRTVKTGIYLDSKKPLMGSLRDMVISEAIKYNLPVNRIIDLCLIYGCYRWILEEGDKRLLATKKIEVAADLAAEINKHKDTPDYVAKIVSDHYLDYVTYTRYFTKGPGLGKRLDKRESEIAYYKGKSIIKVYKISPNEHHLAIFLRDYLAGELRTEQYRKILSPKKEGESDANEHPPSNNKDTKR